MSTAIAIVIAVLAGYLIGSIPFAVLIARARGVDIFSVGSGNPGATNVLRTFGKPAGYVCFLLDAFKGVAGVLIGFGIGQWAGAEQSGALLAILALFGAILGHSFSLFLKFRGGKGVATTVGGLLTLVPFVMLIAVAVWLAVYYTTRYVSLASIALGVSLPLAALMLGEGALFFWLCLVLAVLIILRHRANIQRLLNGTENRVAKKP